MNADGKTDMARRGPWVTLAIVVFALSAYAFEWRELAYDPASPSPATLFGCHLFHWSTMHLLWDVATFGVLGAITEWFGRRRFALFLLLAATVVPPVATALRPEITHYAGLSGLVTGQVALLLAVRARREVRSHRWHSALAPLVLIAVLLAKQTYEVMLGATTLVSFDYVGFTSVQEAHLLSALIGLLVGALASTRVYRNSTPCASGSSLP